MRPKLSVITSISTKWNTNSSNLPSIYLSKSNNIIQRVCQRSQKPVLKNFQISF